MTFDNLPQAPSADFQNIPLAVIYPNDGIEFIIIKTDADGEWSKKFRTGTDFGVIEGLVPHGIKTKLKNLGWKILIDND